MTTPTGHRLTAEWKCTKCGVINRKLADPDAPLVQDKCVSCGTRHEVRRGPRPPFWQATLRS